MLRLPALRLRGIALAFAFLFALAGQAGPAYAKTPGYVLTGGDLGEYAMHFYTDDYLEHPNAEAVEVEAPDAASLEAPYLLYSTWPFAVAEELASGRPLAYLYAGERLVHDPETGAWLKISDKLWDGSANWSGVGRAIEQARSKMRRAELPGNPVLAAFLGREYDGAIYMVTTADGDPYRIFGADFPLEALAVALMAMPAPSDVAGVAAGRPVYNVYATPSEVGTHLLFRYLPPSIGQTGLIAPADAGDGIAWESTPEFDRLFAEAKRQPLFSWSETTGEAASRGQEGSESPSRVARVASLLLATVMVIAVAGGLAGLALNLRSGLRGRRRA